MHIWLIYNSKLSVGVSWSATSCLPLSVALRQTGTLSSLSSHLHRKAVGPDSGPYVTLRAGEAVIETGWMRHDHQWNISGILE